MTIQISAITLGVKDMTRAKHFYAEGMGCPIDQDHAPAFVAFKLGDGSSTLGLYTWDGLAQDAGVPAEGSGFRGLTLSYIVQSTDRVDEVMAQAERAGAKIVKSAKKAQWGGYSGHFSDPDGYPWKVTSSAG